MTKNEFLSLLRQRLTGFSQEDADRSIDYYAEMIEDRIEDGMTEEEAVLAMGSPEDAVAQILRETPLPKLVKTKLKPSRKLKAWEIVLLALGSPLWIVLLAAAFIILLSVYIVLWSVVLVLYATDLTLGACGIAGLAAFVPIFIAANTGAGLVALGIGLAGTGLAILLFFGSNQTFKAMLWLSKKILLGIKFCIVGKEAKQ